MPSDQEKKEHEEKLKDLKEKAQKEKPTEEEKKAKKTIYAQKGKVYYGSVEEEVDIITTTDPNASGGYDATVHVPFCPVTSVTNE